MPLWLARLIAWAGWTSAVPEPRIQTCRSRIGNNRLKPNMGWFMLCQLGRWVVAKSRKATEELRTIASAAPGARAGLEWPKRCLNETRSCFTKELNHDCGNPSRWPRAARFSIGMGTLLAPTAGQAAVLRVTCCLG